MPIWLPKQMTCYLVVGQLFNGMLRKYVRIVYEGTFDKTHSKPHELYIGLQKTKKISHN